MSGKYRPWSDIDMFDLLLLASIAVGIITAPYTKVEESFNIQAMHDLLIHRLDISQFDHLYFPGVVPRTFLGAICIALLAYPFELLRSALMMPKIYLLYACRCILGLVSFIAFMFFRGAVAQRFSYRCSQLLPFLSALTFHLPFYMSRSLPNTFALIGCLYAYGYWLRAGSKPRSADAFNAWLIFGVTALIFRCDLLAFFAPLSLLLWLNGEIHLFDAAVFGSIVFVAAILISSVVDGYLWQRSADDPWSWLWPESAVFRFNTIENRSGEWGVQPWHWYLSSAIPRSLNIFLLLVAAGLLNMRHPVVALSEDLRPSSSKDNLSSSAYPSMNSFDSLASESDMPNASSRPLLAHSMISLCRQMLRRPPPSTAAANRHADLMYLLTPAIAFVACVSFLPHKELRFIYPAALPALLLAAAAGLDQLLRPDSDTTLLHVLLGGQLQPNDTGRPIRLSLARHTARNVFFFDLGCSCLVMMMLGVAMVTTVLGLRMSAWNYPGGYALQGLLTKLPPCNPQQGDPKLSIHIDVLPAMTGVSRFLHEDRLGQRNQSCWVSYSKEETGVRELLAAGSFDYLVSGMAGMVGDCGQLDGEKIGYRVIDAVDGYTGMRWHIRVPRSLAELKAIVFDPLSLVEIVHAPMAFIYRRDLGCR